MREEEDNSNNPKIIHKALESLDRRSLVYSGDVGSEREGGLRASRPSVAIYVRVQSQEEAPPHTYVPTDLSHAGNVDRLFPKKKGARRERSFNACWRLIDLVLNKERGSVGRHLLFSLPLLSFFFFVFGPPK